MSTTDYIELSGFVTGVLGVWLATKENPWNWPIGIINVCIYSFIFLELRLYGDMSLQLFYIIMGFYGWYSWARGAKKINSNKSRISKTSLNTFIYIAFTSIAAFFIVIYFLQKAQGSVPFLDSITTVLSLSATWMMAKKFLEHWLLWIFVDTIYVGMYIYKALYLTSVLYLIFTLLAIYGYLEWKRLMKKEETVQSSV